MHFNFRKFAYFCAELQNCITTALCCVELRTLTNPRLCYHLDRAVSSFSAAWCWNLLSRYDTVELRALKSWRDGQLNLAHGPETKNNEKNKNQKPSSSEETVQAKVRGGSPGGRSESRHRNVLPWVLQTPLFWSQRLKVKVTIHENSAGVGLCTLVSAGSF